MKIYLIQPGDNQSGELTEKGALQLNSLARRLINEKIQVSKVYVNGHSVSRQTGRIFSKSLEVPIISDERFSEIRKDAILGNINESDFENLQNVDLFLDELVNRKDNAIIAIGGGTHRAIISKLTGMPLRETRHFSFQAGGISALHYDNSTGRWRISSLNDVNHLRLP